VTRNENFAKRLAQNRRAPLEEVGKRLGVARREANLSQEVVADALNYSQSDISRLEGAPATGRGGPGEYRYLIREGIGLLCNVEG
jgi:hypothetical protein